MNSYKSLFEEFSYQNLATQILYASIKKNHIAPAYLFTGPKGVGQKKIALRFLEGILNKESRNPNKRNIRNQRRTHSTNKKTRNPSEKSK